MKNILIPTDFSHNSRNAITYALKLFKNKTCNFYLFHISRINMISAGDEPYYPTAEPTHPCIASDYSLPIQHSVSCAPNAGHLEPWHAFSPPPFSFRPWRITRQKLEHMNPLLPFRHCADAKHAKSIWGDLCAQLVAYAGTAFSWCIKTQLPERSKVAEQLNPNKPGWDTFTTMRSNFAHRRHAEIHSNSYQSDRVFYYLMMFCGSPLGSTLDDFAYVRHNIFEQGLFNAFS